MTEVGNASSVSNVCNVDGPHTSDHRVALRLTPHTTLHVRVQDQTNSTIVFLTSSTHEAAPAVSALGSFVYALPNRLSPGQPLSTALVTVPSSVEFATRVARILARRLDKPVYVGNSISLAWGPGGGGAVGEPEVEEVVEAMRKVVEVVGRATAKDGVNGV